MSLFSKKHYEYVSNEIKESILDYEEKQHIIIFMSNTFKSDNSRFDSERFFLACGN